MSATENQTVTKTVQDVKANERVGEIELTIVAKEPARFIRGPFFRGLRSVAIGRDDTGEIKLSLFRAEASEVELGDRIRVYNGWCAAVQGDRVLTTGKSGSISIVEAQTWN